MALKVVPLAHKMGLKGTLDLGKSHWEQEPILQDRPQGNSRFGQKPLGARTHSTNTREAGDVDRISNCTICAGEHDIESCNVILSKTLEERNDLVWQKRLCFACLENGHIASM